MTEARDPGTEEIRPAELRRARHSSTAEAVAEEPGVAVVRRGAAGAEPVVRGQGGERVVTQLGPLPLYGACPGHMDPPLSYLRPQLVERLTLAKGLPSVTLGPAGTGGRVVVDTTPRIAADAPGSEGDVYAAIDSARSGHAIGLELTSGYRRFDIGGSMESMRQGDYRSGGGLLVPARQSEYGGHVAVSSEPARGHRWSQAVGYVHDQDVDFPALPMDLDWTDAWLYDTSYAVAVDDPVLEAAELGFATSFIDHAMSNLHKPNRAQLFADTDSRVRGVGGAAKLSWRLGARTTLETGLDATRVLRDAVRHRTLVASGQRFRDHVWPDTRQHTVGGFAEVRTRPVAPLTLRVGARVDHVASSALAAQEPGPGGTPILEQYGRFYGTDAERSIDNEVVGAANALAEWTFGPGISSYFGAGVNSRAAGATERYFAFSPAPGGYQVGSPALAPERKTAVEWGGRWQWDWMSFASSAYLHRYRNYILSTTLAREDVNGDGTPDLVRGFRNVSARLLGGELEFVPRWGDHFSVPVSFSVVYGENVSDQRPLPEIPPWELAVALRTAHSTPVPWWAELGTRVVGPQDRIDPEFPEDRTPAFSVMHLRAGAGPWHALQIEAGIENLLDADYHEHLTREAVMAAGDLAPGDEIPAPGRSFNLGVRARF